MSHSRIIPPSLSQGDEVRVISPSKSLALISPEVRKLAVERLEKMGLKVTFGKRAEEKGPYFSSSLEAKLEDFHEAFRDPKVKAVLTTIGGYDCNELLPGLDYSLIRKNPKIFCGFSDITALQNGMFAKTGLVTFSGPHFSTFGCKKGIDSVIHHFQRIFFENSMWKMEISPVWSDDAWYLDQEKRNFHPNDGLWTIFPGEVQGNILGGNLGTFSLLFGTEYMPALEGSILFLEEDAETHAEIFARTLVSLTQQKGFSGVKGLVFGRFERGSKINRETIEAICHRIPALKEKVILANADFGHTLPMVPVPIGGSAEVGREVLLRN